MLVINPIFHIIAQQQINNRIHHGHGSGEPVGWIGAIIIGLITAAVCWHIHKLGDKK